MGGPLSIMPLSMAIFSPLTNWKELALISTRSLTSSRPLFISRPWTTTSMFVILCCKVGPTKKLEMSRNAPHSTSLAEKEASNASGYYLRNNQTSWLWTIDNGLLCITLLTMATLKLSTVCSNGRLITTSYRTWRTPKEESLSLSVKMTTSRKLLTTFGKHARTVILIWSGSWSERDKTHRSLLWSSETPRCISPRGMGIT